jgi:hypothetical protein
MRFQIIILTIISLVLVQMSRTVVAGPGTGSVIVQIQGYGTVHGQLQNALVQSNNSVKMLMVVDDQLQTPQGSFSLQATGDWDGFLTNSTLSGTIHDVQGKIHVCVIFSCKDVDFNGRGTWTGQLQTSSVGSGNFTGTITVTNSPYPQIPQGQTIPISGSWTADFIFSIPVTSTSSIPELNSNTSLLLLATLTAATILTHRRKRRT